MAEFPALTLWTDAYLGDTQHLTLEEHGAYLKLLMIAWRATTCDLPDDDQRLRAMLGCGPKKWAKLKPTVMAFWTLADGRWSQKKLSAERRRAENQRECAASAGRASALAKSLKYNNVEPTDVPTESQRNFNSPSPSPLETKKEKEQLKVLDRVPQKADAPKPKRRTSLPANFPNEDGLEQARQFWAVHGRLDLAADPASQASAFVDHHTSRGSTMAAWDAAWRTWYRNALKFNKPNGANGHGRRESPYEQTERIARKIIRESNESADIGADRSPRIAFRASGDDGRGARGVADDMVRGFGSQDADGNSGRVPALAAKLRE